MLCRGFVSFVALISMIRMLRGLREVRELRTRRMPLVLSAEVRRPADDFHDRVWLPLCRRVERAAATRLNRPLSEKERRNIWRSRSPLVLEVALKEIESTDTQQEVAVLLATLPSGMERPDPTGWSRELKGGERMDPPGRPEDL